MLLAVKPGSMKQIDVSFSCICPVIDHEFRDDIVKVDKLEHDTKFLTKFLTTTVAKNAASKL